MKRISPPLLLVLMFVAVCPAVARAQQPAFGVGASVAWVGAPDPAVRAVLRGGPLVRFGESRDGWGTRFGFNWYAVEIDDEVDGNSLESGRLRVRPIMAGYGYTKVLGRVAGSANILAGYAFTSFAMEAPFASAYRDARGVDRVTSSVSNAWVLKPEVSAWIDLTRKISLNLSLGYLVARPDITLNSPAGRDRRPIRADVVMFKIGAVYAVF